eukprot:6193097-Pleurochrysis_carterae.AAC.1
MESKYVLLRCLTPFPDLMRKQGIAPFCDGVSHLRLAPKYVQRRVVPGLATRQASAGIFFARFRCRAARRFQFIARRTAPPNSAYSKTDVVQKAVKVMVACHLLAHSAATTYGSAEHSNSYMPMPWQKDEFAHYMSLLPYITSADCALKRLLGFDRPSNCMAQIYGNEFWSTHSIESIYEKHAL